METPREIAERLATTEKDFTPSEFEKIFTSTLAKTAEIDVQSRLMWVAGMFLDKHPEAFQLPRSLAEGLLASDDFDHYLAGLKGIQHSGAAVGEIVEFFVAAMQRTDWDDRYAALYRLHSLIHTSPISCRSVANNQDLKPVLTQIAQSAPQEHARECAKSCLAILQVAT
jgi:hypothetical protein